MRKHAADREGPSGNLNFNAMKSLLRPFLDPSSSLSVARGMLDSDSILAGPRASNVYGLVRTWRIFLLYNAKLVPDSFNARASKSWAGNRERGLREIVSANAKLGTRIFEIELRAAAASDER